ncbi:MAG: hypothetical protein AB7V22_02700 [Kiritimatiellia bacterium]
MKHLLLLNIALIVASAFGSDVLVGTNQVDLAFEDGILSPADKALIVEDIQHVLSTATVGKMDLKPYNDAKKHSLGIEGSISLGAGGHYWPRAFWKNDFGDYRVDERTSKKMLVVPKKLIDAYREAIQFKNNHPEAFTSLDAFLEQINKGFQPEKMDLSEKKALFWFPPGMPAWSKEEYYDDNLREMKTISFSYPSLLTFQKVQIGNNTVIYCKPVIISKEDDNFYQMTLVYDGGRWRIGPS